MVTKEFEYKEGADYPLDDVPDMGYAKEKLYNEDIFYITEEANKMFVNFFDLESRCEKCKSIFSFKFLLHKLLKSNCSKQN